MKQRIYYGWWIVSAAVVGLSTNPGQFLYQSLGLFIIPLGAEFGWDRGQVGLAATFFTVTLAVSHPLLGMVVDKFGSKRVLIPSLFVFGLCLASATLVTELWHLYLVFVLAGSLGVGANSMVYMRTISTWFDRNRGLAMGIAMAGGGCGFAYVPLLVQHFINTGGWRSAYFALAAIVILVALPVVALVFRDTPQSMGLNPDGDPGEPRPEKTVLPGYTRGQALRSRPFWLLALVFMGLSFSLYGSLVHLVPMLSDRGMENAATVAFTQGVSVVVSRAVIGYLVDRMFAPYIAAACFVASALGFALLATGTVGAGAFVAAMLIGLSLGAEIDLLAYFTSRYFGMKVFGQVYGLLFVAFMVGTATGPLAFGKVYEATNAYVSVLLVSGIFTFVAALIMLVMPRYPNFETEEA